MIVNKDYLMKVRPKILGIWRSTKGMFWGITTEQNPNGNFVDECHLTDEEMLEIFQAGLQALTKKGKKS